MKHQSALPPVQYFRHRGYRLSYRELGEGSRVVVLTHGLLMNSEMFTLLGPVLANAGYRVILAEMLGHGESDKPYSMEEYSMSRFGQDVIALLDHLEVDQAVIGGTSLGANVSLEAAVAAPERIRALFIEMPVLESAIPAVGAIFVPLALTLRINPPGVRLAAWLSRKIPRTHWIIDMGLDFIRRDPMASLGVLDGLTFGRIAPPPELRGTIRQPTLVIGHIADPIHPFSDADKLADELPNARLVEASSIAEWRLLPKRLDATLLEFLDQVWGRPQIVVNAKVG